MNKNETIIEIINLYDEVTRLRNENERLTSFLSMEQPQCITGLSFTDQYMINYGKIKVLEDVLYSWREVKCTYDEETDTYVVTNFDNWLKDKLRKDSIPTFLSYDEFMTYFKDDLKEKYEHEKAKALRKAKGIEDLEKE